MLAFDWPQSLQSGSTIWLLQAGSGHSRSWVERLQSALDATLAPGTSFRMRGLPSRDQRDVHVAHTASAALATPARELRVSLMYQNIEASEAPCGHGANQHSAHELQHCEATRFSSTDLAPPLKGNSLGSRPTTRKPRCRLGH